jgi:opacity protein-like surface antigen
VPMVGRDSAIVQLPMIQRYYGDSTYEAWVSGPVNPRLDSIRVFARTTTVTRREWKPPKRWHVGVTAGYGYGPKGLQPYVGVGITYSVFSF